MTSESKTDQKNQKAPETRRKAARGQRGERKIVLYAMRREQKRWVDTHPWKLLCSAHVEGKRYLSMHTSGGCEVPRNTD